MREERFGRSTSHLRFSTTVRARARAHLKRINPPRASGAVSSMQREKSFLSTSVKLRKRHARKSYRLPLQRNSVTVTSPSPRGKRLGFHPTSESRERASLSLSLYVSLPRGEPCGRYSHGDVRAAARPLGDLPASGPSNCFSRTILLFFQRRIAQGAQLSRLSIDRSSVLRRIEDGIDGHPKGIDDECADGCPFALYARGGREIRHDSKVRSDACRGLANDSIRLFFVFFFFS